MQYQLDVTAYLCPLPLLYTKNALKQLKQGESLEVNTNHQISIAEFLVLCESYGARCEVIRRDENGIQLWINR